MVEKDSREYVRVGAILEIEITHQGATAQTRVEDLGEGGAFVDTPVPLPEGTEIDFKLELPGEETPVVGQAVVRWQQPTVGMGIEFKHLSDADRERIRFVVASLFFGSSESE